MNNYPDDVRKYDHDTRSPFYDDRHERYMEIFAYNIATDPEIMVDVLSESDERYGNIVSILCDLFDKSSGEKKHLDQLMQFKYAWLELAEETAKRYEENKRIPR